MANYYVDFTGGSDSNAGTSDQTAWKTYAKVEASSAAGDTVYWKRGQTWVTDTPAAGTYHVQAKTNQTFDDYGSVDAPPPILGGTIGKYGVECKTGTSGQTINDLELTTCQQGVGLAGSVSTVAVNRCVVHDTGDKGIGTHNTTNGVDTGSGITISDCVIHDTPNDGVNFQATYTGIVVQRCTIYNVDLAGANSGDGVSWHYACAGTVRYCTIYRCYQGGVLHVNYLSGDNYTYGNFIWDCGQSAIGQAPTLARVAGTHYAYNNFIIGDRFFSNGGSVAAAIGATSSSVCEWYQNTVVCDRASYYCAKARNTATVTAKNNVFVTDGTNGKFWSVAEGTLLGFSVDKNYYSHSGAFFNVTAGGNKTFAQWQAINIPTAGGGPPDGSSLAGGTLLRSAAGNVYDRSACGLLGQASIAYHAGTDITGTGLPDITLDMWGRARSSTVIPDGGCEDYLRSRAGRARRNMRVVGAPL